MVWEGGGVERWGREGRGEEREVGEGERKLGKVEREQLERGWLGRELGEGGKEEGEVV